MQAVSLMGADVALLMQLSACMRYRTRRSRAALIILRETIDKAAVGDVERVCCSPVLLVLGQWTMVVQPATVRGRTQFALGTSHSILHAKPSL